MSEQDAVSRETEPSEEDKLVAILNEGEGEPEQTESDGLEEVEVGDKKLRVPKEVKEAWSGMQSKTQAERESRKAKEAAMAERATRLEEETKTRTAFFKELSEVESFDQQLEPYLKLTTQDWVTWAEQDASAASKAQVAINALQMKRGQLAAGIQQKIADQQTNTQKQTQQQRENAERDIAAKIKDWSPAKRAELEKVAADAGYTPQEFSAVAHDARALAILNDAAAYRALRAKAAAASVKKPDETPIEPPAKLPAGSGSGPTPLSDRQGIEAWSKTFLKQRHARGRQ